MPNQLVLSFDWLYHITYSPFVVHGRENISGPNKVLKAWLRQRWWDLADNTLPTTNIQFVSLGAPRTFCSSPWHSPPHRRFSTLWSPGIALNNWECKLWTKNKGHFTLLNNSPFFWTGSHLSDIGMYILHYRTRLSSATWGWVYRMLRYLVR